MIIVNQIYKPHPKYKYHISNWGNILSKKGGNLKLCDDGHGYQRVSICHSGKIINKFVHVLVMETFVGEKPKGLVINHIDGNKKNNHLTNLEYCTQSHNRKQDFIHGRQSLSGENNTQSKLTIDDILFIRLLRINGVNYSTICDAFDITIGHAHNIVKHKAWK